MPISQIPLGAVVDRFVSETDQIESIFHKCKGHASVVGFLEYIPTEEGRLFALWDAWTRFLRSLVMAVSSGPTLGLSGTEYSPVNPRIESEVLQHLSANRAGKSYKFVNREPNWHDERALVDMVTTLALPNAPTVIGAITASSVTLGPVVVPSPLAEIRTARNFCAHKNWKTLSDITAYSSPTFSTLSAHLRGRRTGVEAFSVWTECLGALSASAAQ